MLNNSLLRRHKLTFYRYENSPSLNDDGDIEQNQSKVVIHTRGNLQPYKDGEKRDVKPEGVANQFCWVYYTKTKLKTSDQNNNTISDECYIDNVRHIICETGNWSNEFNQLPMSSHYEYYLKSVEPRTL